MQQSLRIYLVLFVQSLCIAQQLKRVELQSPNGEVLLQPIFTSISSSLVSLESVLVVFTDSSTTSIKYSNRRRNSAFPWEYRVVNTTQENAANYLMTLIDKPFPSGPEITPFSSTSQGHTFRTEMEIFISEKQFEEAVQSSDFFSREENALQPQMTSDNDTSSFQSQYFVIIIAAIVIFVIVVIVFLTFVCLWMRRNRKSPRESQRPLNAEGDVPLERTITNVSQGSQQSSASQTSDKGEENEIEEEIQTPNPLEELEEIILSDMSLGKTLARELPNAETDKFAAAIVPLLLPSGQLLPFIEFLVQSEVDAANHAGSLMRANSVASKVMKIYSNFIAKEFLQKVLQPHILPLSHLSEEVEVGEEGSFEVEESDLVSTEEVQKNQQILRSFCSKLLRAIFDSLEDSPKELRELCHVIQRIVSAKFPGSAQLAVGGFLFLRCFCPAIFTPLPYGIVDSPPSQRAQKILTLTAKTLQNVANSITFGSKEQYLEWLNDFISSNLSACQDYFDEMATVPSSLPPSSPPSISAEEKEKALENILAVCRSLRVKLDDKDFTFFKKLNHVFFEVEFREAKAKAEQEMAEAAKLQEDKKRRGSVIARRLSLERIRRHSTASNQSSN